MLEKGIFQNCIEARTVGGVTPLMYAVQSGNIYIVGECLNRGFNPFSKDNLGQSADDYAKHFILVNGQNIQ